jgi:hypothetical protein
MSRLPKAKDVRELFVGLLDREVNLHGGDAWAPLPSEGACVAEYVDDVDRLRAVAVVDLAFIAGVGTALGLLPPAKALAMVEDRRVSSAAVDIVYEVLNIASSLFNRDDQPHIRITDMHGPGGPLPGELPRIAARLGHRLDLSVEVVGYGVGRFTLILA